MSSHRVGIFPASGGIGGRTVKHILTRLPPADLVLIARHPDKLASAKALGAEVRQMSYDDDGALKTAFQSIRTLFLISYASVEHEYRSQRHKIAIDSAIESGVTYIFYESLGFAGSLDSKESVAHVMQAHLDTESYLEACHRSMPTVPSPSSARACTRNHTLSILAFLDPEKPQSEIKIPHNGSGPGIAWVEGEELAEGTAELISQFANQPDEFPWRNNTVLLSGNKVLTLLETVKILGKVAKVLVQIKQVSDDEFAAQPQVSPNFTYRGIDLSKPWATAFEAIRMGKGAFVSPLLKKLLGRELEDFKTTVSRSL
ncbi:NmrA-like family protein [Colletotrichum incanum]|uniref:NmrA-like family protein n=1 Tax=Colletotrichum incanum TaxID=1573173 RepID=A0A167CF94_COLIC|nr:NmrA-like family protein [Colletotrichum incanum]OHW90396.1 NADB-Rossmann family domain-containing protein [Colletotrichum incanum]